MSVVERAAAAVEAARAAYADAETLATATNQDIAELLESAAEQHRLVEAQMVRLAGAIVDRSRPADETSICRVLGARHEREAVCHAFGLRNHEGAALLSMAAATSTAVSMTGETIDSKFPRVAAALDRGRISLSQARAIVNSLAPAAPRADLDQLAWAEGCLVDEATDPDRSLVPELLVTQAQAFVAVLDPDGVLPASERHYVQREFTLRHRDDGSWKGHGIFTPEAGSAIKAVLDACTGPRTGVRFRDSLTGDEASADRAAAATAPVDDRSPAQKRHDALVAAVESFAAAENAPLAGGEVPRLLFMGTIEAFDAYVRGIDHADRSLTIEHTGSIVPIETADRLVCNGTVQRAVVDRKGHVLELGRKVRTFTKHQRRALAVQYRGCATPGCGFPVAWAEAHHVIWWERGGPTDTSHGILLCAFCHHEVHAGRLLVVGEPGDWHVVPQLRPADRYARNTRTGIPLGPAAPTGTAACHAAAPLAVKLRDETAEAPVPEPPVSEPPPAEAPAQCVPGPAEARLRRRLTRGRPRTTRSTARFDLLRPARHIVMRT